MRERQITRHWKILIILDSSRMGKTVEELAELTDATARTVYRDLDALHEAGFPLTTVSDDIGTRYKLSEEYKLSLKMAFSPMELLALNLVTEAQQFLDGTVFHEALQSAKEKVEATLGEQYKGYADTIKSMFQATFRPTRHYSKYREVIDAITKSLLDKKSVVIGYRTAGTRKESTREIKPYKLWYVNGIFYVIAYCGLRKEVRTFMIDRITSIEHTDHVFEVPKDFDFAKYASTGFKVLGGDLEQEVVLRVHPILKPLMTEQTWHPTQKVEELEDDWLRVSFKLGSLTEIKTWIQGYAPYMIVEKPTELIDDLVESMRACLGHYA